MIIILEPTNIFSFICVCSQLILFRSFLAFTKMVKVVVGIQICVIALWWFVAVLMLWCRVSLRQCSTDNHTMYIISRYAIYVHANHMCIRWPWRKADAMTTSFYLADFLNRARRWFLSRLRKAYTWFFCLFAEDVNQLLYWLSSIDIEHSVLFWANAQPLVAMPVPFLTWSQFKR